MDIRIQHRVSGQAVALLRQHVGSRLRIAGAYDFRLRSGGWQELGLIAGLHTGTDLVAVFSEPILNSEVLSFPGIDIVEAGQYRGQSADWISSLAEVPSLLEVVQTPIVSSIRLLRDKVTWRSRVTGDTVTISTDIGVLMQLANDNGWFLVLALDSDAGLLQFGYARTCDELDWWFSPTAVVEHWAFVECDDGQEVLSVDRSVVPI